MLERKPGALAGSKPLAQWREKGLWPAGYDRLLEQLIGRHGKASGTRLMIQIVGLVNQWGHVQLQEVVGKALSAGCSDVAAIRHLVCSPDLARQPPVDIELKSELARFEGPLPMISSMTNC